MNELRDTRNEALRIVAEMSGNTVSYIKMQIGTSGHFVTLETAAVSMAERALKAEAANRDLQESLKHHEDSPFRTRDLFIEGGIMRGKNYADIPDEELKQVMEYSETCKCQACAEVKYILELRAANRELEDSLSQLNTQLTSTEAEIERLRISSPLQRWVCFHCEFQTSNEQDAAAHFGDRDDPDECKPICKWWTNMDDSERKHQLQDVLKQLNYESMENFNLDKQIGPLKSELGASIGEKWIAYSESKPVYGETVEVLFSGPEIALCHREQEELANDDMREPVDILWDENGDQERSVMGIFWRKFAPPTLPGEEK